MPLKSVIWNLIFWFAVLPLAAQNPEPIIDHEDRFHPVIGRLGMVASQEAVASRVGLDILQQGGNAVDAAVAVGFALAVTLPKAGNLGGGGFLLLYMADTEEVLALDFREMAPRAATHDMFLDAQGRADADKSRFSYLAVGVPGTVAGLTHVLEKHGTMPLKKLLKPAITLARKGMTVSYALHHDLGYYQERMTRIPATKTIFYPGGKPPAAGSRLVQKDLAWSLKQIAKRGADGFYKGPLAKKIAAAMAANGGLITSADLAAYRVREMKEVRGQYRGHEVISMPPPSSGGVHIIQMLNILEAWPLGEYGANSAKNLHLLSETMKLAYADRSKYLGDPDFFDVPDGLTSRAYAQQLRSQIDPEKAKPSSEISPGSPVPTESEQTTHYSVVDRHGNVVAVTYTLNFSFGSGIVAEGTGILLNNEMDDFSAKPGTPNAYGLIGGEANAVAPGKRPLSSMTPTMVFKDGKPFLVTGTPGGGRIITTVLQIISNVVDHGMNIAVATAQPRIHHQWLPDVLAVEQGISKDTIHLLEQMGHTVRMGRVMGSTQSILIRDGIYYGSSDPRRPDALTVGY